jgi:hypothetical protein
MDPEDIGDVVHDLVETVGEVAAEIIKAPDLPLSFSSTAI